MTATPYLDRFIRVADGLRLHYRDYPGSDERPPLLCLHGLTRNARDFAEFAELYSPRFRVIALDFRGRGESDYDPLPERYVPLTYAYDVLALLDELALPQAVFVGTSLGGLVTMTIALAPQRIAAAVLNDVGPELSRAGLDRIKTYVGKDVRFAGWDEAARTIAAYSNGIPAAYRHEDWLRVAHALCREEQAEIRFDYDMAIAWPFQASGPAPKVDLWPLFAALAQRPLLVLRGEHSDLLGAEAAARMQQVAPGARFVVVPGAGHPPDLGEPEALAAIDDFLDSLGQAG